MNNKIATQLIVNHVYTDSEKLENGRIAVVLCEELAGKGAKVTGAYQRWAELGVIGGCYYNDDNDNNVGYCRYYVHPNFADLVELDSFKEAARTNPELDAADPIKTLRCLLQTPMI